MSTKVIMPQLGESVVEGTVSKWLKREGDAVQEFEPLLEISTDKVDTEIPAPASGVLLRIYIPEGQTVERGVLLAEIGIPGEIPAGSSGDTGAHASAPAAAAQAVPAQAAPAVTPTPAAPQPAAHTAPAYGGHVTPVVARMAAEHRLDLAQIKGTGREGRITKKDVEAYLAGGQQPRSASAAEAAPWDRPGSGDLFKSTVDYELGSEGDTAAPRTAALPETLRDERPSAPPPFSTQRPAPAAPTSAAPPGVSPAAGSGAQRVHPVEPIPEGADGELVTLSPMRKSIAEHMVRSKLQTAPHVTTVFEVDLSAVMAHRTANKADYAKRGINLTLTAYFAAASVKALQANPYLNAQWTDQGIYLHHRINLGMAVALDNGLIVPVIKDAQDLNLMGLARAVNDLATRARAKQLKPDEVQGGTFSITNHGVSGSLFATPIINQPQVGILGVGMLEDRVKVLNGSIAIRPCCYVSLTFDHRVADGAVGDAFLLTLKQTLEGWA